MMRGCEDTAGFQVLMLRICTGRAFAQSGAKADQAAEVFPPPGSRPAFILPGMSVSFYRAFAQMPAPFQPRSS